MKLLPAFALASVLLVSASPAAAQVVRVVDDDGMGSGAGCDGSTPAFTTPGAAIAAAHNGDTVLVCPGRYVGNIDFGGKAITLRSAGGPSVTTLDGGGSGSVVTFQSAEGRSSVLEGFTIRGGRGTVTGGGFRGGGVLATYSSPVIRGNVIVANHPLTSGGGIHATEGAPLIEANRIADNSAGFGGAVCLLRSQGAVVRRNVIVDNAGDNGGGISLTASSVTVESNLFSGNSATYGGGLEIYRGSGTDVRGNLIVRNSASYRGSGVLVESAALRFLNNTIAENASSSTSDVYLDGSDTSAVLANNIVSSYPGRPAVECAVSSVPVDLVFQSNNVFSAFLPYSQCTNYTGTNGNISADPLFAEPATGDFHLQPGSPSVDAGSNSAASGLTTDFDGHARLLDADGDGLSVVDMGADEVSSHSGSLPGVFGKSSPVNAAYNVPTTPLLSWAPSGGATGYEYCYDTVDNGACDGIWLPAWGANSVVLPTLDPMTMYHWQVRARNAAGTSYADASPSSWWRFATMLTAPGPFGKVAPSDGADGSEVLAGTLRWASAPGAERYEYCLDSLDNQACDTAWVSVGGRTDTTFTAPSAGNFWQVRAVNAVGVTYADEGAYWYFYADWPPGPFPLLAPANGTVDHPTTLTLRWGTSLPATGYRYCYDTVDNDSCDAAWIDAGTNTSVVVSGLRRSTTYYWMVEAVNVAGTTRATGGSWSFTTGSARAHPGSLPRGGSGSSPRPTPRIRPSVGR